MIPGVGFALALAWSLCGRSLMICGALLCMVWAWCLAFALDDSGRGPCSRFGVDFSSWEPCGGAVVVGLLLLDSLWSSWILFGGRSGLYDPGGAWYAPPGV